MKRILIFGDSILRGIYVDEETRVHRLYRERIGNLSASTGCEVKNCSVMGATVETGEELLRRKFQPEDGDGPATVIFEFGGNDCDYKWQDISANPGGEFSPNTPADRFIAGYGKCIEYAKSLGSRVFLCNLVPLDAGRYIEWISRNLSKANILSWLGDTSMLYRWQEYYNRTAEQIAAKYGCPLIDIRSPFLMSHSYSGLLSPDGIHPTVEGHRVIDGLIAEAVKA
ncbi:MAG: SGNH/GDSL hydrolase family protein [Clostridia bacterium]|nr:SGNH/GDSL hydrolase family protein [Clostridia bacterium]